MWASERGPEKTNGLTLGSLIKSGPTLLNQKVGLTKTT